MAAIQQQNFGCSVNANQPPASAIPGNIGIINAKIVIWDYDPLVARLHQQLTWPFSEQTAEQLKDSISNAQFQLNSVFLNPLFEIQDVWIATKKPTDIHIPDPSQSDGLSDAVFYKLDFVKCSFAGALDRLPPSGSKYLENGKSDDTTGKDIFLHQVWIHCGNIFKKAVPVHPSEYDINLASVVNANNLVEQRTQENYYSNFTIAELQSAPKWSCTEKIENGRKAYWPVMISKQVPDSTDPTHWTLEKLTPTWQGEDFFINIVKGDQNLDAPEDRNPKNELVDTDTIQYKYLIYNPKTRPITPPGNNNIGWVDGISNEAFYSAPVKTNKPSSITDGQLGYSESRKKYWWKYKSYILIEIGYAHPIHNYFIELCHGRNPRFLHLGEEWDNIHRIDGSASTSDDFKFVKKCRVLDEYKHVSCDELFRKNEFRVSVRNHLGRIVITFPGYEKFPWVINRFDHDPSKLDLSKIFVGMVVPSAKLRIHGGNISCQIGFAPTRYSPSCSIPFPKREADSVGAEDKDIYMSFATIGGSELNSSSLIKKRYYKDKRLALRKIGYELDASQVEEIIENKPKIVPLYDLFHDQYLKTGKGWVLRTTNVVPNEFGVLPPDALSDGMVENKKGKHHIAKIKNANNPGKKFKIGLSDAESEHYPYPENVSIWNVNIILEAGAVVVPPFKDETILPIDVTAGNDFVFRDYITPIVNQWSFFVLAGGKIFEGKVDPFDVAPLAQSIKDSWTAEDFTTIKHDMQVRCYIPDSNLPINQDHSNSQISNLHALGQRLLKLHEQSFYVTVSYWWENGVGGRDAPDNLIPRRGPPRNSDLLIQMSGIAYGGTLEKSVNKLYMDFTIKDYTSILEHQPIYNSPFFDGVNDALAIYELVRMAWFDDTTDRETGVDRRPLGFIQKVLTDPNIPECQSFRYNGEECVYRNYDLPGSYSPLTNPDTRTHFQNGETIWSAIIKIAQLAAKVVYFDRWGVLKLENSPAIEAAFNTGENEIFRSKFDFVTTPFHYSSGNGTGGITANRFRFDPNKHASHLVYNVVKYSRSVEDCVNQIILFTASNDLQREDGSRSGGFVIEGYTFYEQILDPTVEGFIGYRKPFYQSNGVFGGLEGVRNGLLNYAKMKYPPAEISFETYSVPGLKPLDIITLDDNLFYITEISHDVDPEKNSAWMTIQGAWYKSFHGDLGFIEDRGGTDSGAGGTDIPPNTTNA